MRLRNMLKICLVFWKSEPQYAYKLYAYKKKTCILPLDGYKKSTSYTIEQNTSTVYTLQNVAPNNILIFHTLILVRCKIYIYIRISNIVIPVLSKFRYG